MEILKTERRTHERWLNLFTRTWRHNGREGEWLFASRKEDPPLPATGIDAVIIVAVVRAPNQPPRLVVLKEFRVPVGDYVYAFPAGLTEEGESLEDVARRELREETGYELATGGNLISLGHFFSSPGFTDEHCYFVLARPVVKHADGPQHDGAETIIDCREFSQDLLREMIAEGEIRDSNTLSIWARLIARGEIFP